MPADVIPFMLTASNHTITVTSHATVDGINSNTNIRIMCILDQNYFQNGARSDKSYGKF